MFRNIKACKRLIALLLPLFLILGYLAFQTSSSAQTGCPGNLLQNGDFATGVVAVGNGNFPPSTVPNWSPAFGSPQIVASMGCGTSNFVKMWGNKVVGEGIKQTLNIQAGHTYKLSACVRVDTTNPILPKYVRFNVRASNGPLSTYTAAAPVIGLTGNITATTWTPVTLANWTAPATPANLDTITINPENDNTANDGNTVSWGWIDNVCLQEVFPVCFTANTVCQGQPTSFTSCATNAASWSWNFGDGTSSNQQNPTHTYSTAGTYNVTHCLNGSICVTNQVTVKPTPPTPVITGPNNVYAGQNANYSITTTGVSYSWTVSGGTINGSATGNSVNVTWTGSGGSIAVTVTNKSGCSSTARMPVGSDLFQCDSCKDFQAKADLTTFSHISGGVYNVTPTLSGVNLINIIRVTANVISSSVTYSPSTCGTSGPANSYVVNAFNAGNLVAVPYIGGHEVIWHGFEPTVSGLSFPMQIKFPPPPSGLCRDALTFCIKYTFTTKECRTCEVIVCYGPFKRGGPIKGEDEIKITTPTP